MENNIKKYDLKFKKVCISLIIGSLFLAYLCYILFISQVGLNNMIEIVTLNHLTYRASAGELLYIGAVIVTLILIYMLELLLYKIKDVLIFDDDGITYYAPEYKKVFIPKDKIKDIYITNNNQMKIILKDYEIKKSIRAFIWTMFKDLFFGANPKNVFRINLSFIECDIKELRNSLIQFNLDSGSSEANELVKNILKKYNYKNIEELKKDEKALTECVMKLYNMGDLTHVEISAIIGINASKVSKLIRKGLN